MSSQYAEASSLDWGAGEARSIDWPSGLLARPVKKAVSVGGELWAAGVGPAWRHLPRRGSGLATPSHADCCDRTNTTTLH